MNPELRQTADGSHTLYVPELNETYHSVHGAITESKHVFINAGLHSLQTAQIPIQILEIGFGTGLNALLTWMEADLHKIKIHYITLEPSPLGNTIVEALNYTDQLQQQIKGISFASLHATPFDTATTLSEHFILMKKKITLEQFHSASKFHLVYFDAFGPRVQPEIWSIENFKKLFDLMAADSILVTYCAKGDVRRTMQAAGFVIEKLPGPPGKREMLRAYRK